MSGKETIRVIGRVAQDPEMRTTQGGKNVTSFSIPVQERKDSETVWYKIVAWEKQAEIINQYVTKGKWLAVDGVPSIETWDDKASGETRVRQVVTLRDFTFCGGNEQQDSDQEQPQRTPQARTQPTRPTGRNVPRPVDESEDVPF